MRKRISSSHAKPIPDLIIAPEKDIRFIIITFIEGVMYPLKDLLNPKAPALTVFPFHKLVYLVEVGYPQVLLVPK